MKNTDYEQLISLVPCCIFTFTNNGSIVFVNDTLLQKLQYALFDLEGQSVEKIFTLSTRIFHQTHFFPLLRLHAKANEIFLMLRGSNGDDIPVLVNAVQTFMDGQVVNICACIVIQQRKLYEQEILAAKRASEEAVQKNELLQKIKQELEHDREMLDVQLTKLKLRNQELAQLSNIFAHDLQEPVRKVSVFTDVLGSDPIFADRHKAKSLMDVILQSSNKMRKLLRGVQEYLYLSIEPIQLVTVDLNKIISNEFLVVKNKFPSIQVELELNDLPEVVGDVKQLAILFREVLTNCFNFRADRTLEITIESAVVSENAYNSTDSKYRFEEFLQISIQDNGIGFDPETETHIFKILKKLDVATDGIGMGLAVCKKIVENHKGKIFAVGQSDLGAKFVILLPMHLNKF